MMFWDEVKTVHDLKAGDIVRNKSGSEAYVVTGTFGGRATAVRSIDIHHANEWMILRGLITRDAENMMKQASDVEGDTHD